MPSPELVEDESSEPWAHRAGAVAGHSSAPAGGREDVGTGEGLHGRECSTTQHGSRGGRERRTRRAWAQGGRRMAGHCRTGAPGRFQGSAWRLRTGQERKAWKAQVQWVGVPAGLRGGAGGLQCVPRTPRGTAVTAPVGPPQVLLSSPCRACPQEALSRGPCCCVEPVGHLRMPHLWAIASGAGGTSLWQTALGGLGKVAKQ